MNFGAFFSSKPMVVMFTPNIRRKTKGLYLFLYSGGSLAGTDYRPGRGVVRVYDRSGAEQPVHGGKYPDFLRGRESGLAEDH